MGNPSRVRVVGPLAPYAAGFRAEIEAQGYRRGPVCDQLRLMAHVSRWLVGQSLDVGDLTPERVKEFLVARRAAGYTLWLSNKGVAPLLSHLRSVRAVPMPVPPASTPVEDVLAEFRRYLLEERGIASTSANSYVHVARLFLTERSDTAGIRLDGLGAADVAFVPALLPPAGADARASGRSRSGCGQLAPGAFTESPGARPRAGATRKL